VKAIFWDNDGVLVDSEPLYFETTREAMAELGVELTLADFAELSLRTGASAFDVATSRGISPERIEAARLRRNARYGERLAGVELIPGVREALAALHGRVPMAVVTSSRRVHFEIQHARTGARPFFEFVLTKEDFTRFKPDPQPYLMAAARLGVVPGDCLVVEDSERGLRAAVAAGMRCAVVPSALSPGADFSTAVRVLGDVRQVPALFEQLSGRGRLV
jgi:HAD superfamily hydrolase (TIGR01509 family)